MVQKSVGMSPRGEGGPLVFLPKNKTIPNEFNEQLVNVVCLFIGISASIWTPLVQNGAKEFEQATSRSQEEILVMFREQQIFLQTYVKEVVGQELQKVVNGVQESLHSNS